VATARVPSWPELWGGLECTVNRVGERYHDQLVWSGHDTRRADLDRFAALGFTTLRYPVLWERTLDWGWSDARLGQLRDLGVTPIVGLLHHGSGPPETSLLDPDFPEKLAGFAARVASRYPWVHRYTPVNEPLTTARFSCLYGFWYPHQRDARAFAQALLNQCRAVVLSMAAIRKVNPAAQLVQTEDLGRIFSRPTLAYQAEFENHRRWLTWDLLCGRLDEQHALWSYLVSLGLSEQSLRFFQTHPCPPDVVGVNHYVTSDRYLDERVDLYGSAFSGGNGQARYVDVEAVRAPEAEQLGLSGALTEAWQRYRLPIAITESHLGCTREEQLRWISEAWATACRLRARGIDVRAMTIWSLLGSYDWDSLVTFPAGHYEPGVFDVRGRDPRPTAIASMARALSQGQGFEHPVLDTAGWWRRPERFTSETSDIPTPRAARGQRGRRVLITGATGTLGSAFARLCRKRGLAYELLSRAGMDIADDQAVERTLDEEEPWAVVNAAGYVRVDEAEASPDACFRENLVGPVTLARACERRALKLVTFSSDLVFGGRNVSPYLESSALEPLNVYGRSKAAAECRVLEAAPAALVVRTSAFFGPWDPYNFVTVTLTRLSQGQDMVAAEDSVVSPTYVPDLVEATLDLLIDGERGLWHLANRGEVSWAGFARLAARRAGLSDSGVTGRRLEELNLPARRPHYSALGSERGLLLPSLDQAMDRYLRERRA
jgi:dTDP-4-dehydrorhamnose reductase